MTLGTILKGFGKHFEKKSSKGTADDYALSFDSDRYSVFLSHSWQSGRMSKYLALLFEYSFVPAIAVSVIVALLVGGLQVWGVIPPVGYQSWPEISKQPAPLYCGVQILGLLSFALTLCNWVQICSALGCVKSVSGSKIFVDKLCIRQDDEHEKQKGLDSIAGYLRNSDKLLVLWDPTFFSRLWCCFEFALFLHRYQGMLQTSKRMSRMQLSGSKTPNPTCIGGCSCGCCSHEVPVEIPIYTEDQPNKPTGTPSSSFAVLKLRTYSSEQEQSTPDSSHAFQILPLELSALAFATCATAWSVCIVYNLLFLIPEVSKMSTYVAALMAMSFLFSFAASGYVRSYCQHRNALKTQLELFAVSTADCSEATDRVALTEVIRQLYSDNSGDSDGVENFEAFVQTNVKDVVLALLGPVAAVPPSLACGLACFNIFSHLDNLCSLLTVPEDSLVEDRWGVFVRMLARYAAIAGSVPVALSFYLFAGNLLAKKQRGRLTEVACNLLLSVCATIPCTLWFAMPILVGQILDAIPAIVTNFFLAVLMFGFTLRGYILEAVRTCWG